MFVRLTIIKLALYEDRAAKIEKKYCIEKCIFMESLSPSPLLFVINSHLKCVIL